ncbi:MAG: hypothetical protein PPP55_02400 [Halorubrum sp.]
MSALRSIRPAVSGVVRSPILVAIMALFGVSQLPNLLVEPSRPVLAAVVSLGTTGVLLLVLPFVQGGLLGMASEAIRGTTSVDTFLAEGKANYVSLLLAYVLLLAVNVAFAFVVVFAVLVGIVGASVSDVSTGEGWTLLAVLGIVVGGLALVYLLVTFFVQFYAHAIVLDDCELIDGFRRSVGVVRANLLGVFGYSVVLAAAGAVFGTLGAIGGIVTTAFGSVNPGLPSSSLTDLTSGIEPTMALLVGFAVVYVLSTGLFGALYATYSVAFYEDIRPDPADEPAASGRETEVSTVTEVAEGTGPADTDAAETAE